MESSYGYYIKTDLEKYLGEWIVIIDDDVVAHGKDVKKVYNDAKAKYPRKRPLLAKVPEEKALIF